jgi:hypothetical protein
MANGQAIILENPGSGNTESHIISSINNGTNQVTLNRNLFKVIQTVQLFLQQHEPIEVTLVVLLMQLHFVQERQP